MTAGPARPLPPMPSRRGPGRGGTPAPGCPRGTCGSPRGTTGRRRSPAGPRPTTLSDTPSGTEAGAGRPSPTSATPPTSLPRMSPLDRVRSLLAQRRWRVALGAAAVLVVAPVVVLAANRGGDAPEPPTTTRPPTTTTTRPPTTTTTAPPPPVAPLTGVEGDFEGRIKRPAPV